MSNTTRQQIIDKASELLEHQGYHGTGLNQIIKESGAPRGSLYYYFPDGKEELAAEAIAGRGQNMAEQTRLMLASEADPIKAIYGLLMGVAQHFAGSHYCGGAPLAAVALETASTSERLRQACQMAYDQLSQVLAEKLMSGGYPAPLAARLATLIAAAIEGGIILSRVRQSATPLEEVAETIKTLLKAVRPT